MAGKQKILVIIMDQFRADLIHGPMAQHIDLPNIDALRKDAVTFTNHFSVVNPCGPARASIFTGMYAMNHRSVRNGAPLSDNMTNLAREARKSGYDPRLFGYTDTSRDPRGHHENDAALKTEEQVLPGFSEALEMRYMESYPWRSYLKSKGYDIPKYSEFYNSISPDPARNARADDPPFYSAAHSDTAFLTKTMIHDLAGRTDQDWFSLITYLRPHPPLVAPAPYNTMYKPADLPLPTRMAARADEAAVHPFLKGALDAPSMQGIVRGAGNSVDHNNDDDVQMLRAIYLGLASEVDTHIGKIMEFLKESGQYDDTVIVLMADHGEMLGEHHMWGKQNIYDAAYRVPLIIRDPRQSAQHGTVVEALTESIDITPTILDLIGQKIPTAMDGASLQPFLAGETPVEWRDCVHLELDYAEPDKTTKWQEATGVAFYDANISILREERWKLVHFNGDLPPLLFDLRKDPFEMTDLAQMPEHGGTVLRLTRKLLSFRMSNGDRTLTSYKITADGAKQYSN